MTKTAVLDRKKVPSSNKEVGLSGFEPGASDLGESYFGSNAEKERFIKNFEKLNNKRGVCG